MIDKILNNRPLTHVIFWVVFLIFQSQVFLYSGHSFKVVLFSTLAILPSILMASYFLTYYQLPKLAYKKKYLSFGLSLLLSFYVFTLIARVFTIYLVEPMLGLVEKGPSLDYIGNVLISFDRLARNYFLPVFLAPFAMAIIKLLKQRGEVKSKIEKLEKEKATTELNFLKTQIHPHFLLNTLNNIYALTLKKSDLAPDSILKLSEMLTYVLYKCNEKYVSLKSEIQLLEHYIALEELRYGDELTLEFNKEISSPTSKIAPLILLSIVENAFKHGASTSVEKPTIIINLKESGNRLTFSVYNNKDSENEQHVSDVSGIGGANTRKQLEILYPNSFNYEITETESTYQVFLEIDLKTTLNEN